MWSTSALIGLHENILLRQFSNLIHCRGNKQLIKGRWGEGMGEGEQNGYKTIQRSGEKRSMAGGRKEHT